MSSAWQIHNLNPTARESLSLLNNLHLSTEIPKPKTLLPKTALVRIHAASINSRDLMIIAHDPSYPQPAIKDLTPCSDGAGEIEAVGEGSSWKVGDRVILQPNSWLEGVDAKTFEELKAKGGGDVQGTLRQYAVLDDAELYRAPAHFSFEEAASIPTAGGTAANALFYGPSPLKPGMTILTQGTGGVSCFAIQLASALGARVIATSSSDAKLEVAKQLGATHTINYRTTPDWADEVLRLTDGRGVDHVVDVGGSGTIEQSLKAVKQGGLVSVIGILSESRAVDIVPQLLYGGKTARGVFGSGAKFMAEEMVRVIEKYGIRPAIAAVYEWEDAKEAFKVAIEQSFDVGKIVIRV